MIAKVLFVSFISFVLVGCTGVWVHPTKSQNQFNIDSAKCHADSLMIGTAPVTYSGNSVADAYQGVANESFSAAAAMNYRNLCIQAAGWQFQSNSQSSDANNDNPVHQVSEKLLQFDDDLKKLCADSKFSSYYAKTSCSCHQISFLQKSDKTFASSDQLLVMEELFNRQDQMLGTLSSFVLMSGDSKWKALMIFTHSKKGELDAARVSLFNRLISWGQYNQLLSNYCATIQNKKTELGL